MVFATRNHVGYHAAFYGRGAKRRLRAEVWIGAPDKESTAAIYTELHSHRELIERQLGYELTWEPQVHGTSARICVSYRNFTSEENMTEWPETQRWLVQTLSDFRDVFDPVLEQLARERAS